MAETRIPDIGKYQIVELVGEGAMGVVYKAKDSVLDRIVAIKVMNESIARQDDLRKRFLREAQAAASLQHPNVVSIYDMGEMEGHLFIAMEFVEGIDLEKLLELGQPLSLQAKLDIVIDVLTGLTFAHKRGIIHRDIKPANIRVTEDGRAKIMDFGVAHLVSSSMTTTGSFLGTPSYMAPEQITEGHTTPGTDIFAVGGVLYQLLTQFKPFEGPTLQNLFFKIITEKPKKVSELMPGLPHALDRIVEKAMAKEPSERYMNALDMANELSAVRAKLSGPSYPESVSLSVSVSSAIEQARKKAETRSRAVAFAGAGAVTAIIVLVAWSQLAKPRAASPVAADTGAAVTTAAVAQTTLPEPVTSTPAVPTKSSTSFAAPSATEKSSATAQTSRNPRTVTPPKPTPPRTTPSRVSGAQTQNAVASTPSSSQAAPQTTVPQQQIVTPPPAPVIVQRPPQTQSQETAASAPPPAPAPRPATSADISPVIEAYARAIESRDVSAIRRVYPGLTADQQRGFEAFFQAARSINVTFRVDNVEGTPSTADARLVGSYEYVNSAGRTESQPVSFAATLRRDGSAWRLVSVR